jgi:transposase
LSPAGQRGRVELEYVPAYPPVFNRVEYIWGYWKHHELPNFCPHDFSQLSYHARQELRRRLAVVIAFWEQVNLFPL